jgi:hypothetical protein
VIDLHPLGPLREQTIGQRSELPREELHALAVGRAERPRHRAPLDVEHAQRRLPDRHAQHRLDRVGPDAAQISEAIVGRRRRRLDDLALRHRARDDPARHLRAHRVDAGRVEPARPPEPRRAVVLVVVQLEVRDARPGDLDRQRERVFEQRPELLLTAQVEQPPVEIAFALDRPRRAHSQRHGTPNRYRQYPNSPPRGDIPFRLS